MTDLGAMDDSDRTHAPGDTFGSTESRPASAADEVTESDGDNGGTGSPNDPGGGSVRSGHVATALLTAYKGLRVPRRLADAIDRHLVSCPECRHRLARARSGSTIGSTRPPANLSDSDATAPEAPAGAHRQLAEELWEHPDLLFEGWLGSGGMGSVFLARQRLLDRRVAVKLLHPRLYDRPGSGERLKDEIKLVAKLDHPHVVAAFSAESYRGRLLFVMEFVDGVSLQEYLAHAAPLPAAEACDYARQAALGLQHAHEAGLVHRDVKPHNLILTPQGWIKVLDFGLARAKGRESGGRTGPGAMLGTADYVAPEQALDATSADARSDLYSLGCTLYHALAGHVPFPNATPTEKIARHVGEEPADLAKIRPDLPPEVIAIIRRLMAKDRDRRFRSAAEVVEALVPFVPGNRSRRWTRRRVLTAGVAMALVAGGAGLLAPAGRRYVRRSFPSLFPPDRGELVLQLEVNDNLVAVAYSLDGTIVAGGNGGTLFAWDGHTGKSLWEIREHTDRINFITASTDGTRVASVADDHRVLVWETATSKVVARPAPLPEGAEAVAFSPDATTVYAGDGAGTLRAFDIATGKPPSTWRDPPFAYKGKGIAAVCVSPDGRTLYVGFGVWHDDATPNPADGKILLVDSATGKQVGELSGLTGSIISLALSSDGTKLVGGGLDGLMHVWDTATREKVHSTPGFGKIVRGVAAAPDNRRFTSSTFDGPVRVWELGSAEPILSLTAPRAARFNHLSFSPNGTRLAAAGRGQVAVWQVL
jgi:WD40 repeat protein